MKNMLARYSVAIIAIPAILIILMTAPSWVFNLIVTVIMLATLYEWIKLFRALKLAAPMFLSMTMGFAMLAGIWAYAVSDDGFFLVASVMPVILGIAFFGLTNLHHDIKQKTLGNGAVLMALFLCAWGGGSLILVREFSHANLDGRHWILLLFALAWSGDAGAMHIGKLIGRHKMTPIISPQKTVEGIIGGIVVATASGYAMHHYFELGVPLWHIFILAPLTVVLAHIGDLTASMAKRAAGVKDSGRIIPGHGGFLDRFDNLLLTAPLMYLYVQIFVV
jgi:phosphatidate cytidylyltransferase